MRIQNTTEEAMRFPIFPSCALWPGPKTAQNLEGGPGAGKGFLTLWEDGGKSSVLFPFPIFSSPSRPYRHLTFERRGTVLSDWRSCDLRKVEPVSIAFSLSKSSTTRPRRQTPRWEGHRECSNWHPGFWTKDTKVSGHTGGPDGKTLGRSQREETPHCCAILMHHRKSRGNWVQGTQQLGTTLLSIKLKLF